MCSCFSIRIFRISGLHFTTLPIVMYVVVICGKTAVTWFAASTRERRSAFSIPHLLSAFSVPQFRILPTDV